MGKHLLILFLWMSSSVFLYAQQTGYSVDTVVTIIQSPQQDEQPGEEEEKYEEYFVTVDTALWQRNIDIPSDSIKSWQNRKEFAYVKNLDSLLLASQQETQPQQPQRSAPNSFSNRLLGGPVIKTILWGLAIFFVVLIIYQLLKTNGLFQRKSASRVTENWEDEEVLLLHNDFDDLVHQACKLRDYRMAVRYLFLKTLQQLRDKGQINYELDKTNSRYVYELPEQRRNDFSRLIFQYEYVWYGHFTITKEQYEKVQKGFYTFFQKI